MSKKELISYERLKKDMEELRRIRPDEEWVALTKERIFSEIIEPGARSGEKGVLAVAFSAVAALAYFVIFF